MLVREGSRGKLEELIVGLGRRRGPRSCPVIGDLDQHLLGVSDADRKTARRASITSSTSPRSTTCRPTTSTTSCTNVDGTRNAVELANELGAKRFHHVSSIAVAGRYRGLFLEDMFDEGQELDDPYSRTKFESESVVREEATVPWRVYRPGIVVGSSQTGEMDKIDGPYYFFKVIQRLRDVRAAVGAGDRASRAARSTSCRSTSSRARWTTSRTRTGSTARPST